MHFPAKVDQVKPVKGADFGGVAAQESSDVFATENVKEEVFVDRPADVRDNKTDVVNVNDVFEVLH